MIDLILTYTAKGVLTLMALYIYFRLVCSVYPYLTVRMLWKGGKHAEIRGIRRVVFPEGRAVVYLPTLEVRKYIYKYAIFVQNGNKFLRCRINPKIDYMRYDVISLDVNGKLLDVVSVREHIKTQGDTLPVSLPSRTAYAYVVPRKVDGMYASTERVIRYSVKGMWLFVGLCAVTTVIMSAILYNLISSLILMAFPWFVPVGLQQLFSKAVLYSGLSAALVLLAYYIHSVRVINK